MSEPIPTPEPPEARRALAGRLVYVVTVGVTLIWFLLDVATKELATRTLPEDGSVGADLGVLALRLVRNPNASFGIPGLFPGFFLVVTVVVVVLVSRALSRTDHLSLAAAYGLVLGGVSGNAVDRVFRHPGFPDGMVVDFLDLGWWPVFNLADSGIVVGAVLVLVVLLRMEREERAAERVRAAHRSVRPDTTSPRR